LSIVVDASVLVAALIDSSSRGAWAESVLTSGPAHAPELALVETINILRRLERARTISTFEANAACADLLELNLETYPFEPFGERVWSLRHSLTSYDAWYVALAEALECPLATLDQRLARAPGPLCRFHLPPHQGGRG
jgi:predicted nucleic acid-binding protein